MDGIPQDAAICSTILKKRGDQTMDYVGRDQIDIAKGVDLYDYLIERHADDVIIEGDALRLKDNRSVCTKKGYRGFTDFSTNDTGDTISYLTAYLGYDFQDAVRSLCGYRLKHGDPDGGRQDPGSGTVIAAPRQKPAGPTQTIIKPPARKFELPPPVDGPYRHLYAYLTKTRRILSEVVEWLIGQGVMYQYQEGNYNNIAFVNPERTFVEIRGTNTYKPFHRVGFSDPEGFWWFKSHGIDTDPDIAFIFEAAIDAISLFCTHLLLGSEWKLNVLYCSIAGVTNQKRIDRIKAGMAAAGLQTALAVDNDDAGERCRQKNPDCLFAPPRLKDWNETWKQRAEKLGL